MSKLIVLGVRRGGKWFVKSDPTFGTVSLKPLRPKKPNRLNAGNGIWDDVNKKFVAPGTINWSKIEDALLSYMEA